jgi:uncharacterized protein YjbI with pentapeptide repeats
MVTSGTQDLANRSISHAEQSSMVNAVGPVTFFGKALFRKALFRKATFRKATFRKATFRKAT